MFDVRHRGASLAKDFLEACDRAADQSARDDGIEVVEAGGDVEGQAVKRGVPGDAHADGADFR